MNVDTPALLEVKEGDTTNLYRTKVRHMAGQIPGCVFSKYQRVQFYASGLISMKEYSLIMNKTYENVNQQKLHDDYLDNLPENLTHPLYVTKRTSPALCNKVHPGRFM